MSESFDDDAPAVNGVYHVSLIRAAHETATTESTFSAVMDEIRSLRWAGMVEQVRDAYSRGGKDAAAGPKKKLPGILFSGTFSKRSAKHLIHHSGLICADLDELGDQLEATIEHIVADAHTLACFRSPTGTGLKVVFRCDPEKPHAESFAACQQYVLEHFGLQIDEACKDVSRICFFSHDPEAFVADSAEVLPYPPAPVEFEPSGLNPHTGLEVTPGDDYDTRGDWSGLLLKHGWTKKGEHGWSRPGKTDGISATFGKVPGRFYVFSSNAPGFEPHHVYRPWHVYAILEHHGDFAAAAKALGVAGFGTQRPKAQKYDERTWSAANGTHPADREKAPIVPVDDLLKGRRFDSKVVIAKPIPTFTVRDTIIGTPGNLVTLYAQAKAGKSAAEGGMIAATMALPGSTADTLGFVGPNTAGHAVIHIDTELSTYDWQQFIKTALRRVGLTEEPPWLISYTLTGLAPADAKRAMEKILADAHAQFKGIHSIFIDGPADLIMSPNNEEEAFPLVIWLHGRAIEYHTCIVLVMHMNPGSENEKGRGHLGSQLERKSESNITMAKDADEVTTYWGVKQRGKSIPKAKAIAFRWSEDAQMHVLCENIEKPRIGRPSTYDPAQMIRCVPGPQEKPATIGQIFKKVREIPCGISDRAFRDVVGRWTETGEVTRVGDTVLGFTFKRSI